MEDLKSGIEHLKQAKAHMSKANGIMSDHISKFKALEEENAQLKAELGGLQIQPDASYMKLPLDADGAAIHVGDAVYFESEVAKVCGMRWNGASWSLSLHDRAEDTASHRCRLVQTAALIGADGVSIGVGDIVYRDADPEPLQVDLIYAGSMGYCTVRLKDSAGIYTSADAPRLSHKKPEPLESEVLDADGVPIEVGDTVYCDDDPEQLMVDSFDDPGCVYLTLAKSPNGILYTIEPSRLSHECPDSWEKLEEDARKTSCDYAPAPLDANGLTTCNGCRFKNGGPCYLEKDIDLMKRAKKLAGIEDLEGGER